MDTNKAMQQAQDQIVRAAKARRAQALAMKKSGKKYREIGEALTVTPERARQLVAAALKETAGG